MIPRLKQAVAVLAIALLSATAGWGHTVNVSTVNVRSGPGTSYSIVGTLSQGTVVYVIGTSGSWSHINYPKSGWVYSAYLTDTPHVGQIAIPSRVVMVIFENKSYSKIIGNPSAPYINSLASLGATFTSSHGVTHPSQPNYIALFSGSTQGVTNDVVPPPGSPWSSANLASRLLAGGRTFAGYCEGLPSTGSLVATYGRYARKHNPWSDFSNVPSSLNKPFSSFPTTYSSLPTVSVVVPDLYNDMHDGPISAGDTWLKSHLSAYVLWAKTHNGLLIITFDEDDFTVSNQIPTVFVGPMVKPGRYGQWINHYNVLRTLCGMYRLSAPGKAATATPITNVWKM